jgi:hypothetical protein
MKVVLEYKEKSFPNAGPNDWVLPGKRRRPADLDKMLERIAPETEKVAVSVPGWHAVRHMNNSIMLNSSVDIATRRERLGHTTDAVNLIYSHANNAIQAAASELIQKRLKEAEKKVAEEAQKPKVEAGHSAPSSPLSVTGSARGM